MRVRAVSFYCLLFFFFFNDTATTEIYTYDTLFPYTTLFRSRGDVLLRLLLGLLRRQPVPRRRDAGGAQRAHRGRLAAGRRGGLRRLPPAVPQHHEDRKSTRLNSSH